MIEDGVVTYSNLGSAFVSWRISNTVVHTLVLALVTTIAALQARGLFFDLVLGLKRRGVMRLHDLHMFLLSGESSPLAVLDAILRNDWITRKRLRGDVPAGTTITRDPNRIRVRVLARLLLLLCIGPILNIIAIALSLENTKEFSIGQAGLGGLVFGIDFNSQVEELAEGVSCERFNVEFESTDEPLTSFHKCNILAFESDAEDDGDEDFIPAGSAFLNLLVLERGSFTVFLSNSTTGLFSSTSTEVRHGDTVYLLKNEVSEEDIQRLARFIRDLLAQTCGTSGENFQAFSVDTAISLSIAYVGPCPAGLSTNDMSPIFNRVRSFLTLKEASDLLVVRFVDIPFLDDDQRTPFVSGDSLPLFRRSRGSVGLLAMLIVAGSVVALRVFFRFFFAYNDFPIAAEVIIRDRFNLPACDSMLPNATPVEYRKKYQLVDKAHFGLESREAFPEVEHFEGGTV